MDKLVNLINNLSQINDITTEMIIEGKDRALIDLLRANSRESVSELARQLGLSRSTVKDRIARLEKSGVITGYTVRFSEGYTRPVRFRRT